MEALTLGSAISFPTRTTYRVASVLFDWDGAAINVVVAGSDGARVACDWNGAAATTLMVSLNKANLSSNSLHKRILNQAVTDGKLPAGSVTGAPD